MKLRIKLEHTQHVWNVNAECRRVVSPIAAEFGMTAEQFLARFSQNRLPAQLPTPFFYGELGAEPTPGFRLRCADPKKRAQIQRAAEFSGQSFDAFVFESVMCAVRAEEEGMILSPKTGGIIGNNSDLYKFLEYL
jgi:hypothetical protein